MKQLKITVNKNKKHIIESNTVTTDAPTDQQTLYSKIQLTVICESGGRGFDRGADWNSNFSARTPNNSRAKPSLASQGH